MSFNSSGTDPLCGHCGKPVIGVGVYGNAGVYHPECVRGGEPTKQISDCCPYCNGSGKRPKFLRKDF